MSKFRLLMILLLVCAFSAGNSMGAQTAPAPAKKTKTAQTTPAASKHPTVTLKTTAGDIVIELFEDKAPKTVANFLAYVKSNQYNGTIFHRVIDGFMIQGGGFTKDFQEKETRPPVTNEADNGVKNGRGTLAMARTNDPQSATAQFFINLVDNSALDFKGRNPRDWGYAVFGRVIKGMEVVDAIGKVKTGHMGPFDQDSPLTQVVILSATAK